MKFPTRNNSRAGGEGGGSFLRLKDGESVTGILGGELYSFYSIGFGGETKIVGPGEGGKKRYRHNFIVKEGDGYAPKIWEFGAKAYDDLSALENGGWDLQATLITIARTGSTKENTKYTITPLKTEPSPAALKAFATLTLNVLEHKAPQADGPVGDSDGLPF